MIFFQFDHVLLKTEDSCSPTFVDSELLDRDVVDVFTTMLADSEAVFDKPIPLDGFRHISLRWTSRHGLAALATFCSHVRPLIFSALAAGEDANADTDALCLLQFECHAVEAKLVAVFGDSMNKPGPDLRTITERPVVVSVLLPTTQLDDLSSVANMKTSLAAAFFEWRKGSH